MSLVSIRDVRKSFGANEVLKGVSLDIAKGDVVAIIGRSGSGKSTLLRCINGLETYQSGAITADSIEVGGAGTLTRSFGAIRVGGRISLIGGLSGPATILDPRLIFARRANVQGISVGTGSRSRLTPARSA